MKQATLIVILALCIGFLIWLPFQFQGKPAPVAIDAGQARNVAGSLAIEKNQFEGSPEMAKLEPVPYKGEVYPFSSSSGAASRSLILKGVSTGTVDLSGYVDSGDPSYWHRIKQKRHKNRRPKLAWKPGSIKLTSVTDFLYTDQAAMPRLSIGQMTIPPQKCPAHDRPDHQVVVFQRANGDKLTMCMEEFIDKTTKILELEGATVRYTAAPKKENEQ